MEFRPIIVSTFLVIFSVKTNFTYIYTEKCSNSPDLFCCISKSFRVQIKNGLHGQWGLTSFPDKEMFGNHLVEKNNILLPLFAYKLRAY